MSALAHIALVALLAVTSPAAAATSDKGPVADAVERTVNAENNVYAVTRSYCGQVYAIVLLRDPAAEPMTSRLPITVFVSEPTHGLARTQVLVANPGSPLLTVQTEPYVDNCHGSMSPRSTSTIRLPQETVGSSPH